MGNFHFSLSVEWIYSHFMKIWQSVLNIEVVNCESEWEISFFRNVIIVGVVWDWTQHDLQISGSLVGLVVKKIQQHPEQNWFRVIETQTWQCVIQILQSFVKKESHLKLNSVNWSWQSSLQLNRIFFSSMFLALVMYLQLYAYYCHKSNQQNYANRLSL